MRLSNIISKKYLNLKAAYNKAETEKVDYCNRYYKLIENGTK